MGRILRGFLLAAAAALGLGGAASAATTVYRLNDPTSVPSPVAVGSGDTVLFVDDGTGGTVVRTVTGEAANIGVGLNIDGTSVAGYAGDAAFVFMRDAAASGDFVIGNDSTTMIYQSAAPDVSGNLSVGGNVVLGNADGSAAGNITVDNALTLSGTDKVVRFNDAAQLSRLEAGTLSLADGAVITVKGGYNSAFTVNKASSLGRDGDATLKLDGNAMSFVEGVTLYSGATIKGAGAGGALYLGEYSTPVSGVLNLAGGTLDGSQARLEILPKSDGLGTDAAAEMIVTDASVIKGEVSAHAIDAKLDAEAVVFRENGKATWTVRNLDVRDNGVLRLGATRAAAFGGDQPGILRLARDGGGTGVLDVKSGGSIVAEGFDFTRTAAGYDKLKLLGNNNIIGTGHVAKAAAAMSMQQGSTLDLSGGGLFLDGVNATLNGNLIFGVDSDARLPFALVGTNYVINSPTSFSYGAVGDVTIGSGATVAITHELARTLTRGEYQDATAANTLIDLSGTYLDVQVGQTSGSLSVDAGLLGESNAIDLGLLGKYTLAVEDDKLYVSSVDRKFDWNGTQSDLGDFIAELDNKYGGIIATPGLAANVYRLISYADPDDPGGLGRLVDDPSRPEANRLATDYFNAIIQEWMPAGDYSAANMFTGANVGRVTGVAIDSAAARSDNLFRLASNRRNQLVFKPSDGVCATAFGSLVMDQEYLTRVYVTPTGRFDKSNNRHGGYAGYAYDAYGVDVGVDRTLGPLVVGAQFGYSRADYEDKSALDNDSTIHSYSLGGYGTYAHGSGLFATVAGGYTISDNDIRALRRQYTGPGQHQDLWNRGEYENKTWHLGIEAGWDWRVHDSLTITPSIGFTYVNSDATNHREYWDDVALLEVRGVRGKAKLMPVRVQADYEVGCGMAANFILSANAGYTHNFTEDKYDGRVQLNGFANPTQIDIEGRRWGKNTLNVGAGLRMEYNRLDVDLKYDYYRRSGFHSHQAQAMLGVNF